MRRSEDVGGCPGRRSEVDPGSMRRSEDVGGCPGRRSEVDPTR